MKTTIVYIVFTLIAANGCQSLKNEEGLPSVRPQPAEHRSASVRPRCTTAEDQPSCFYHEALTPNQNTRLIVFAHGLFSDLANTWGDLKTQKSWPAFLREDERFELFDIYLMGYPSACFSEGQNIHETAKNELSRLEAYGVFDQYSEIYIIAHSMGGLVVKSLLTDLNHPDEEDIAKLRKVKAVVFLGTPSQGVGLANVGRRFCTNPQIPDMTPTHLNTWLSSLDDSWNVLMDDRKQHIFPRAFCAFETKGKYNVDLVVPREASNARCDGRLQGLAVNHSDLSVPQSKYHHPYVWTMNRIAETAKGISPLAKSDSADEDSDIVLAIECDLKPLPKKLPIDREVSLLFFWQRAPGVPPQNFQSAGSPGDKNHWQEYNSNSGHVCQITNYGAATVSNVKIIFGLRFKGVFLQGPNAYEPGPTKFIDEWPCTIRKIDPGASERFVFYMKQTTHDFLEVSMPEFVELRRFPESKTRRVPLLRHEDQNTVQFIFPTPWPPRETPPPVPRK